MARASLDALIASLLARVIDLAIRRWHWRRQLHKTPAEALRSVTTRAIPSHASSGSGYIARCSMRPRGATGRSSSTVAERSTALVWREGMVGPVVVLHAEGALGAEVSARAETLGLAQHLRPDLVTALRGMAPGTAAPRALWNDLAALITGAGGGGPLRSG